MAKANEKWRQLSDIEKKIYEEEAASIVIAGFDDLPVDEQKAKINDTRKKMNRMVCKKYDFSFHSLNTLWKINFQALIIRTTESIFFFNSLELILFLAHLSFFQFSIMKLFQPNQRNYIYPSH